MGVTPTPPEVSLAWANFVLKNANSPEAMAAWINFMMICYQTTGQWPSLPNQTNDHPNGTETTRPECGPLAYQYQLPNMVPMMRPPPEEEGRRSSSLATGYDYANSPYFLEAKRLIAEYALRPVGFQSTLVFSLILAWCNFPLFREMGDRKGEWMTLSTTRLAKEVGMRVTSFRQCIGDLQGADLITPGQIIDVLPRDDFQRLKYDCVRLTASELAGKHFFKGRFVQEKNWIYTLKYKPSASPPRFDPFNEREPLDTTKTDQKRHGKDLEQLEEVEIAPEIVGKHLGKTWEAISSASGVATCMNESIDECMNEGEVVFSAKEEAIKPETPLVKTAAQKQIEQAIAKMSSYQKAKYDFLHIKASFVGYARLEDGATTLDQTVCCGFAYNTVLTLEGIQGRYDEVVQRWATGQIKTNPLGFLQRVLKQDSLPPRNQPRQGEEYDRLREDTRPAREPRPVVGRTRATTPAASVGLADEFDEAADEEFKRNVLFK